MDCNTPTPDCPVPTNAAIELRFDRFLLPDGALGQGRGGPGAGLILFSGVVTVPMRVEYDVVERVLLFRPSQLLQPNTLYTAAIVPSVLPGQGLWAFDEAPFEDGAIPSRFSFTTGDGPSSLTAQVLPTDSCDSIIRGPLATCAGCHTTAPPVSGAVTAFPPMGLDLSSARGLYYTALGRVAHETETADSIGFDGQETPVRFGVQMNILDPENPATSYLLYKLLQKPDNFRLGDGQTNCELPYHPPVLDGGCSPPSADETARLGEWFVLGDPMPKDGPSATGSALRAATDVISLRRLARWVASGTPCVVP